jgi:hypothetical protein
MPFPCNTRQHIPLYVKRTNRFEVLKLFHPYVALVEAPLLLAGRSNMSKPLVRVTGYCTLAAALGWLPASVEAGAYVRARAVHADANGGASTGFVAAGRGANGAYARGRRVSSDGAGGTSVSSGGAYYGENGATARRSGETNRGSDGAVAHQGTFSASGAKGSLQSAGSSTKDANGVTANRTTEAVGANGNSYGGTTSYSKDSGFTHSGTCTDAAGNGISCR